MLPVAKPQGAYILARGCSIDQDVEGVDEFLILVWFDDV